MRRLRQRLSYGNVTATIALFVALGGTSFAAMQLPRNSVGSSQIKRSAVGSSELRRNAVSSRSIRDGSVTLRDVSRNAQTTLRGTKGDPGPKGDQGPPGVTYRAVLNSGGGVVRGNATTADHQGGSGRYAVAFGRDVSDCVATATLSDAQNGPSLETPPPGRVTVGLAGPRALIRTYAPDGSIQDLPFSVIVAC